ncbi:MAG: hypothetical protein V1649_04910 [Patescibacteria group bacterium]
MDKEAKRQYMEILRKRYFKASKKEKGKILNEYCGNTKQERKYVIKKFNYKVKLKTKYRKKSSFLLSTIPVKTSADFDRNIVGNEQVDFVESCGSSASGEYVNNLSICDIFSSWWEGEAIMGKGQQRALFGLDSCRKRMPFMWKEFHPDN